MPLPNREKSNKSKERKAFRRGKHDRMRGKDIEQNPFVRSELEHEPNMYMKWRTGWKIMDDLIKSGEMEEYDK